MKRITSDEIIIEHVEDKSVSQIYQVGKNVHLTLVYVIKAEGELSVEPSVELAGEGASADILGVVYLFKSASVRMLTLQHHMAPNTTSNLLVKSVLTQEASFVYEGSIIVDKPAQKTDAYQRNENLLMDDHTRATSKPALEILANDVRCTHGAVVKTLDREQLWYAQNRGVDIYAARDLIGHGFLQSTLASVSDQVIRGKLEHDIEGFTF